MTGKKQVKDDKMNDNKKLCDRCKIEILEKENYFSLTSFMAGKKHSQSYFHVNCFKDAIKRNSEQYNLQKRAERLVGATEKLLESIQGDRRNYIS